LLVSFAAQSPPCASLSRQRRWGSRSAVPRGVACGSLARGPYHQPHHGPQQGPQHGPQHGPRHGRRRPGIGCGSGWSWPCWRLHCCTLGAARPLARRWPSRRHRLPPVPGAPFLPPFGKSDGGSTRPRGSCAAARAWSGRQCRCLAAALQGRDRASLHGGCSASATPCSISTCSFSASRPIIEGRQRLRSCGV